MDIESLIDKWYNAYTDWNSLFEPIPIVSSSGFPHVYSYQTFHYDSSKINRDKLMESINPLKAAYEAVNNSQFLKFSKVNNEYDPCKISISLTGLEQNVVQEIRSKLSRNFFGRVIDYCKGLKILEVEDHILIKARTPDQLYDVVKYILAIPKVQEYFASQ